jgi:Kef-type K+ transport system membrane component KefB
MKQHTKSILLYTCSLTGFLAIIWLALRSGKGLEPILAATTTGTSPIGHSTQLLATVSESFQHPLAIFILQIILIIAASQVCSYLIRKVGQPSVMGEIMAGILLGPSLMGAVAPGFSSFIFPASSLGNLQMLSQVGLILFMFVIGMELDMTVLKKKAGTAMLISYFSIIIPFALGMGLSYFLYQRFAHAGIPFYAFSLFTGIAMSITAFPVLARIIRERGISNTRLGAISLTAAAVGDVAAWCILAFIIAIIKAGSVNASLYTIASAMTYVCLMLFVAKPLLARLAARGAEGKTMKRSLLALIFLVLLLSSYCCEVIGIHALFGAFLAGVIMPTQWNFRTVLIGKIEDVALVLLLPLFFVYTGLRTQIGLLGDTALWLPCMAIIAVAVVGKFGGSAFAAHMGGEPMKESLSIGALMNTRGLVELVVLNIGYDLHILTAQYFTMMVLMALVTTLMTNPILNLINRVYKE